MYAFEMMGCDGYVNDKTKENKRIYLHSMGKQMQ
jgi:hypothetical protein